MPIGYWSLWGQQRSVTLGDLSWPWNPHDARSRVTASSILTSIISTIHIQVNSTTPSCVYSRFRWNLAEGCSLCDVIASWPDLTWSFFFYQKLRKRRPISYGKFQHDTANGVASSKKKHGGCINPPPLARVKIYTYTPICTYTENEQVLLRKVFANPSFRASDIEIRWAFW